MRTLPPHAAALLTSLSLATAARAQGRAEPVVHVPGAAIDSAFRLLAATPTPEVRPLPTGGAAGYQLVVIARRATAPAEVHDEWADVVLVRRGAAVLRTGPALADGKRGDPGEWRGSTITAAEERRAGPGDVLVIPAGVAHQWRPGGGEPFEYVVLKVRRAAPPPAR